MDAKQEEANEKEEALLMLVVTEQRPDDKTKCTQAVEMLNSLD